MPNLEPKYYPCPSNVTDDNVILFSMRVNVNEEIGNNFSIYSKYLNKNRDKKFAESLI